MICTGQEPCDTSPFSATITFEVYLFQNVSFNLKLLGHHALEDVSSDIFPGNSILGDAFLITSHLIDRLEDGVRVRSRIARAYQR